MKQTLGNLKLLLPLAPDSERERIIAKMELLEKKENKKPFRIRIYSLWTYDVWGNKNDGWQVNDRNCIDRRILIHCKRKVYNENMSTEFVNYDPTDRQLAIHSGFTNCEWDGDSDHTLYAETKKDQYPVGELQFEGWEDLDNE